MPISGKPGNDKRQIPAGKIKGAKPTPGHPTKPEDWQTGLNWTNNETGNNSGGTEGGNTIDPIGPIDPILPPPPPPPPGTDIDPWTELTTQDLQQATRDNPIYIATNFALTRDKETKAPTDQAIAQIKQKWPNWNGKNGKESAFSGQPSVEHVPQGSAEWNKLLNAGQLPARHMLRYHLNGTGTGSHKPADPNYFEQNPGVLTEDRPYPGDNGYFTVYKIYNTYWNNQGTWLGESGGQNYYTHRELWWIQDIIKLPDTEQGKQPLNGKMAFAGTVQPNFTFLSKNPNALENIENATGMFYYNPKFNQRINLPRLKRADYMYAHNLEYNQTATATPNLETNTYTYYYTPKFNNNQPLHSTTVKDATSLFHKAKTLTGDLSNLQYPLIAEEPENYRTDTAITKTYWD